MKAAQHGRRIQAKDAAPDGEICRRVERVIDRDTPIPPPGRGV